MNSNMINATIARTRVRANIGETPNPKSLTYSRQAFLALLAQEGAEEIRAHFGVTIDGMTTLIFTAVDSQGQDILDPERPMIMGIGRPCPPFCGPDVEHPDPFDRD